MRRNTIIVREAVTVISMVSHPQTESPQSESPHAEFDFRVEK